MGQRLYSAPWTRDSRSRCLIQKHEEAGLGISAFISYASEDREKAHEICKSLEGRGATCWIAPRNVRAGREYADEIVTGIERSACIVVLLSQAANTSAFVCREVERAVANHKPIFPVRIEAVMPDAGLELFISGTHWLDAWEGDWDDHMRRLARDVADLTAGAFGAPARPTGSVARSALSTRLRRSCLAAATGGFAMWTFLPDRQPRRRRLRRTAASGADRRVSQSICHRRSVEAGTRSSAAVEAELPIVRRSRSGRRICRGQGCPRAEHAEWARTTGVSESSSALGVAAGRPAFGAEDSRAGSFRGPTQRRTGRVAR